MLHCTSVISEAGINAHSIQGNPLFGECGGGQSAVYGPDGRRLTKPLPPTEEGFVYAELPIDMLLSMRHFADPVGHYSRPELLWLGVDRREKKHIQGEDYEEKKSNVKKLVTDGTNGVKQTSS